jgi:pimeloyl-ACP methyl ester carboxylesterase
MPFASVNSQRISFEDTGSTGPAVIFNHGFLMDHEMFAPQVDALRGEFRCITWDQRGFGQTEVTEPFTYWDSADDALALLDHLGVDRAVFAGMSQGGFLSMRAALRAPQRVAGLVLIDTQSGLEDPALLPAYEAMAQEWIANGPQDPLAEAVASLIMSPGYDHSGWVAKWKAWPQERLAHPFRTLVDRDDITDRLAEITGPAIVFHGDADASIPLGHAEKLSASLAGCQGLVVVAGGGHASNLSHPAVVNPPLLDFCRRVLTP